MKGSKILVMLLSTIFILVIGSLSNNALATEIAKKSFVKNFEMIQLSNDVILEKALKGELVNNEHTQVIVTDDIEQHVKKVLIDKILTEETLSNGDVITKNSSELSIFVIDPEKATNEQTESAAITPLDTTDTQGPTGSTVAMKIILNYDSMNLGGYNTRKLTKYTVTPLQFDSQWHMTYFEHKAGNYGTGWKSDGTMYVATETTNLIPVTTIVYNSSNTVTTNFSKYTALNSDIIGGSKVLGEFKYRRGTGTISTYEFDFGW
ncbi:hypothetical protein [Lysinibacillus parviboronicapiens]|uniref:hypothetical protein n=1 Tax=Lysinibacillus parviboronicapiens TaxID=436516 RepID=UPI000D388196|nr:hypothetical protein [Lysinibacillus parviboronicapiens]